MSVRRITGSISSMSALVLAGALATNAAAQLPPNFRMQRVLVNGLDQPISLAFIPRLDFGTPIVPILVGERAGRLLYYEVGSATPPVTLLTLTDIGTEWGELGFLGLCVDPRWGLPSTIPNDYVYILYTERDVDGACGTDACYRYRIERLHINFAVDPPFIDSRALIYAGPSYDASSQCCHWAGDLHFVGLDTMLYSTGDHWTQLAAVQDPSSEVGKIMRLQRLTSGTFGPPEMLFSGLRNPFRFNTDGTGAGGTVYIGNVGSNGECGFIYEELNAALATAQGTNFGWPCTEGPPPNCDCSAYQTIPICAATSCLNFTAPLWAYDHSVGNSITGGPVYRGIAYPDDYAGDVLVADWLQNWIKRVSLDGSTPQVIDFLQPNSLLHGGIVDLEVGPDGNLYAVQLSSGGSDPAGVYRFVYIAP